MKKTPWSYKHFNSAQKHATLLNNSFKKKHVILNRGTKLKVNAFKVSKQKSYVNF